jgi:hypothetical protein
MDTPERRVWGERRPKDRVTLQIILVFTLTCLKTFTQGCVSVKNIYTLQQDKCKCKKIGHVNVNDLHAIYRTIDTYAYKACVKCRSFSFTHLNFLHLHLYYYCV